LVTGSDLGGDLKALALTHLEHPDGAIRNLAAVLVAYVRRVEGDDWADLFPLLLSRNPPLQDFTIVNVFLELFQIHAIAGPLPPPLDEQLTGLIPMITHAILSETTPAFGKYRCLTCLRLMLHDVPSLFDSEPLWPTLFDVLEFLLPEADLALYREVHRFMLELTRLLHSRAISFIDRVHRITALSVECEDLSFRVCSLHFWEKLAAFEMKEFTDPLFPLFSFDVAPMFTGAIIGVLLSIDPADSEDANGYESIAFLTLQRFVEVIDFFFGQPGLEHERYTESLGGTRYPSQLFAAVDEFSQSDSWAAANCCVFVMRAAICPTRTEVATVQSILARFPLIEQWMLAEWPKLGHNAVNLIADLIKHEPTILTDPEIAPALFALAERAAAGPPDLQIRSLELFAVLIESAPGALLLEYFQKMMDLVNAATLNPALAESEVPFKTLDRLIRYAPPQFLSGMTPFLYETLSNIPDAAEGRQVELLRVVTHIIQKLGNGLDNHVAEICPAIFALLEEQSEELYAQAMILFSSMFYASGPACADFVQPFLIIARAALSSSVPPLVALTALAMGDLCRRVRPEPSEMLMGAIDDMFGLLEGHVECNEGAAQTEAPALLRGLGWVAAGMDQHFEWSDLERIWTLVTHFASVEFDPSLQNDVEYGLELFAGVACAFVGIILCAKGISSREEHDLCDYEQFVRNVKLKVFPLFGKIWALKECTDDVARQVLELGEVLLHNMAKKLNVRMRSAPLLRMIQWASSEGRQRELKIAACVLLGQIEKS
jgi:hypothetical protein